jgi:hypothetical protein
MGLMGRKLARGGLHLRGREPRFERGVHAAFRVMRYAAYVTRLGGTAFAWPTESNR